MMAEETGRILWTAESKHYLLRLIRENAVIISPNVSAGTMQRKETAWTKIEECFASEGFVCQLSKIKRLWKRMKDNARQNTMTANEQQQRGIKHCRPPSDLDWQVHHLLATRDSAQSGNGGSKAKKRKISPMEHASFGDGRLSLPPMPPNITVTPMNGGNGGGQRNNRSSGWPVVGDDLATHQHPMQHSLIDDSDDGDDYDDDDDDGGGGGGGGGGGDGDYDNDPIDIVDLLTPADQQNGYRPPQQQQQQQKRLTRQLQRDALLEPVTIIEEVDTNGQAMKTEHDLSIDCDEDDSNSSGGVAGVVHVDSNGKHAIGRNNDGDADDDLGQPNDEYAYHQQHTASAAATANGQRNGGGVRSSSRQQHHRQQAQLHQQQQQQQQHQLHIGGETAEHRSLQRELMMHEIQLRLTQRQHEDERMHNDRQLFRKRSRLLDLQIQRANWEWQRLQQSAAKTDGAAAAVVMMSSVGHDDDDDEEVAVVTTGEVAEVAANDASSCSAGSEIVTAD